jgi:hypothetical protein
MDAMGNGPPKDVFNIIEEKDGKARWVRIGSAFVNRDGSINALLESYPTEGKIQIRDRRRAGRNDTSQPHGEKGASK